MSDDFIPEPKDEPAGRWDSRELTEAENERLREMEERAQAENSGPSGAPSGLFMLLVVPILLVALALFMVWGLGRSVATAPTPAPTVAAPTGN